MGLLDSNIEAELLEKTTAVKPECSSSNLDRSEVSSIEVARRTRAKQACLMAGFHRCKLELSRLALLVPTMSSLTHSKDRLSRLVAIRN